MIVDQFLFYNYHVDSLLGEDNKTGGNLGHTQLARRPVTNFLIKKKIYFFTKCLVCAKYLETERLWSWYFYCLYPNEGDNWHANFRVISVINKNKEGLGSDLLSKVFVLQIWEPVSKSQNSQ